MVFATFTIGKKEYRYSLLDDKVYYSYEKNGRVYTNFTDKEIEMMDYILTKITISKNPIYHVNCGSLAYHDKKFQMFYDKISERKFVYEVVGNKYIDPLPKDNAYLTNQLNPMVLASKKEGSNLIEISEQKMKIPIKLKRGLTTAGLIVEVSVAVLCLLKTFPENPYFYFLHQNQEYSLPYSFELIEDALRKNKNLSEKEKEFVYSHMNILEDNQEYIDMAAVIHNIENLYIEYGKDPDQICIEKNASGYFRYFDSKIYISGATSFEEVISDLKLTTILSHEIGHAFTPAGPSLGTGLVEAVNETMNYEYHEKYSSDVHTYASQRICLYALCEILGTDSFKVLNFRKDITPLIQDLTNLIDDEDMAYQLINNIDKLAIQNAYSESPEAIRTFIYDKIGEYFYAKYGYDITQDEIMMAYFSSSGFVDIDNHIQLSYLGEPYIYEFTMSKGYFRDSYIEGHPNVICCIYEASEESEGDTLYFPIDAVEITSSNRTPSKVKIKSFENRIDK